MTDSLYRRTGKRWVDALCAFFGIVLLTPVLFALGLLVLLTSGWPILFRQERTGRNGKPFCICKFRTMTNRQGATTETLLTAAGDARVTAFGKWLRRTKCDELPQLWNVLTGDMSLVGPRPEVPYFTQKFTPRQLDVLKVRPGITGPAANAFIAEEKLLAGQADKEEFYLGILLPAKLESDLRYAESIAFNTDLKLIANTFARLLMKSSEIRKLSTDVPRHGI
jgi:lipopolysaccharide/colanic/teichoic acid biosynthesis glycosyltransferase